MDPRRLLAVAAILALSLVLAACGGDDSEEASEALPEAPTLTVPGSEEPPEVDNSGRDETTDTETSTTTTGATPTQTTPAQADPAAPSGGAAAPQTGGATPDTEENDQPPPADSPASEFEQFCQDNPGAC